MAHYRFNDKGEFEIFDDGLQAFRAGSAAEMETARIKMLATPAPSSPCAPAEPAAQGEPAQWSHQDENGVWFDADGLMTAESAFEAEIVHRTRHGHPLDFGVANACIRALRSATPAPASPCASTAAAAVAGEPVAARWSALPYATPIELWKAFKSGTEFVLHYHGKTYPVTRMEPREHVVYVQPPGMPVKVYPDGRNCESAGDLIWLEQVAAPQPSPGAHTVAQLAHAGNVKARPIMKALADAGHNVTLNQPLELSQIAEALAARPSPGAQGSEALHRIARALEQCADHADTSALPSTMRELAAKLRAVALTPACGLSEDQERAARILDSIPTNWELSWGNDDEEEPCEWRVHRCVGNPNDREWDLIGRGATPSAALAAARLTQPRRGWLMDRPIPKEQL